MKQFLVISAAPLIHKTDAYYAYAPYEKEMQIWAKYADEITFCCPIWKDDRDLLISRINFKIHKIIPLREFQLKENPIKVLINVIKNTYLIFKAIKSAHHIHLRCPGNITLLAIIVQVFFPNKIKTAKYAGNWDSKSNQPWSYRLQKWLINNPYLSKNMQVMVYGKWPKTSKNIKTFFTATYSETQKAPVNKRNFEGIFHFLFVGTLVEGKQPLFALDLFKRCLASYPNCNFTFYGEGILKAKIQEYIETHALQNKVFIMGNQPKEMVREAYQKAHFLLLPSKSEGWPKVVAEAMFWGCVPVVTPVSCVPYMLDYGIRGILLTENLESDVQQVTALLSNEKEYHNKSEAALIWSQQFTTEAFEQAIKKLIQPIS